MKKQLLKKSSVLVIVCICLLASGCASQMGFEDAALAEPVGFWHGLWHGMTAPISWVGSLFNDDIAIYAIYNNGGWYDWGFILGIWSLGSGTSSATKKRS